MSIREEIEAYLDRDGMVEPHPGDSASNVILYTSLYYIILVKQGLAGLQDLKDFEAKIAQFRVSPGEFRRNHWCQDLEAFDDYAGLTAAAYFLRSPVSTEILSHGLSEGPWPLRFVFNWKKPGSLEENGKTNWGAELGRNPAFVAHLYFSDNEIPPLLNRMAAAASIIQSSFKDQSDQDAWLFSWLLIQVADHKCWMINAAASRFKKRLYQVWPGGMKQVLGKCLNPDHPIARHFVESL